MMTRHEKTAGSAIQGFTLLEVIIALAVLSMLITPIFASFAFSIRSEQRALLQTLATYTAQMKMEEAYGMDKTALIDRFNTAGHRYFAGTAVETGDDADIPVGAETGPAGFYYVYTAVPMPGSMIDDDGNPITFADLDLYAVTIVVGYTNYDIHVKIEDIFHVY